MDQVPKSIATLRDSAVDTVFELYNHGDQVTIASDNLDWSEFRKTWTQTCSPTNAVYNQELSLLEK